jgi:hypothetical protein
MDSEAAPERPTGGRQSRWERDAGRAVFSHRDGRDASLRLFQTRALTPPSPDPQSVQDHVSASAPRMRLGWHGQQVYDCTLIDCRPISYGGRSDTTNLVVSIQALSDSRSPRVSPSDIAATVRAGPHSHDLPARSDDRSEGCVRPDEQTDRVRLRCLGVCFNRADSGSPLGPGSLPG